MANLFAVFLLCQTAFTISKVGVSSGIKNSFTIRGTQGRKNLCKISQHSKDKDSV
jgi:hypothetical protein